jgi:hypothetical protein
MRWKARRKRELEKYRNVILSAAIPFARDWNGGVEGSLAANERLEVRDGFMKFRGESAKQVGVLRLRGCFAARSGHSAQDDKVQDDRVRLP